MKQKRIKNILRRLLNNKKGQNMTIHELENIKRMEKMNKNILQK